MHIIINEPIRGIDCEGGMIFSLFPAFQFIPSF